MPNKHANPMLGWNPPAELSAWVRAEAARRGVTLKVILDEAVVQYREHVTWQLAAEPASGDRCGAGRAAT